MLRSEREFHMETSRFGLSPKLIGQDGCDVFRRSYLRALSLETGRMFTVQTLPSTRKGLRSELSPKEIPIGDRPPFGESSNGDRPL
jgi:hypothetical protein